MLNWVGRLNGDGVIWSAWKNGKHSRNTGYGFRLAAKDRDQYFDPNWQKIAIDLPQGDGFITVHVRVDNQAFWRNCCELRSAEIRQWLYRQRYAPWLDRRPPKFEVHPIDKRHFRLVRAI
jgi:hypothetical protein